MRLAGLHRAHVFECIQPAAAERHFSWVAHDEAVALDPLHGQQLQSVQAVLESEHVEQIPYGRGQLADQVDVESGDKASIIAHAARLNAQLAQLRFDVLVDVMVGYIAGWLTGL